VTPVEVKEIAGDERVDQMCAALRAINEVTPA
jgi:hypothetical protein